MTEKVFDRSAENIGNIFSLEHLNLTVPDHAMASLFYLSGLGLTRDPYIDFGSWRNMWVNIGDQQLHLPIGEPQQFRGHIGLVMPNLDELEKRLSQIGRELSGTGFSWDIRDRSIEVTGPWGNRFRCHGPDCGPAAHPDTDYRAAALPTVSLGLIYLDILVPAGTAEGICCFYDQILGAPTVLLREQTCIAIVRIGKYQSLRFSETTAPIPPYDRHHIAIYLADFDGPYQWLKQRDLITEESDQHQYRFQALLDPQKKGRELYQLEHEVRSLQHPMYNRHLVNRNASQNFFSYSKAKEAFR